MFKKKNYINRLIKKGIEKLCYKKKKKNNQLLNISIIIFFISIFLGAAYVSSSRDLLNSIKDKFNKIEGVKAWDGSLVEEASATESQGEDTVNTIPTSSDFNITMDEDNYALFSFNQDYANHFPFDDVNVDDSFAKVKITSLPTKGKLITKNNTEDNLCEVNSFKHIEEEEYTDVALNDKILISELLYFIPEENEFGDNYTTFNFVVIDSRGAESIQHTATINITPLNDVPSLYSQINLEYTEDSGPQIISIKDDLGYSDPEDDISGFNGAVIVNWPPTYGTLECIDSSSGEDKFGVAATSCEMTDISCTKGDDYCEYDLVYTPFLNVDGEEKILLIAVDEAGMKNKIISTRKISITAEAEESFSVLDNSEIANILIVEGRGRSVAENLEKFIGVNHIEIADGLMSEREHRVIAENLEKFIGLNHIEIADSIIREDIEIGMEEEERLAVAENLEKFVGLNIDIANKLIEEGEGAAVAENFGSFTGIPPDDHANLVEVLIEAGGGAAVAENLANFTGIPPDDHANLVEVLIEEGGGGAVAENFGSFTGIPPDDHANLVEVLIEANQTGLNSEIANWLIDAGETSEVQNNIQNFTDLNSNIAQEIIDQDINFFASNINRFTNLNTSIAGQAYEDLGAYWLSQNLNYFLNLGNNIVNGLMAEGYFSTVAENLEKFPNYSHTNLANSFIYFNKFSHLANNLGNFSGLNNEIADHLLSENYVEEVANNLSGFTDLDKGVADHLLSENYVEEVANNLSSFTGLDKDIAEDLIEHNQGWVVAENLASFSDITDSDHLNLAYDIIGRGDERSVAAIAENFNTFTGVLSDDHNDLAHGIIEVGEGAAVFENFGSFTGITGAHHPNLADHLISKENGEVIANHLEKFEGIDAVDTVNSLIELGDGAFVAANFNKFIDLYEQILIERAAAAEEAAEAEAELEREGCEGSSLEFMDDKLSNMNIVLTPVDDAPIARYNIPAVYAIEDQEDTEIDLRKYFSDIDNNDEDITITSIISSDMEGISTSSLSANHGIIIDYQDDAYTHLNSSSPVAGENPIEITVTAMSNTETVSTTFDLFIQGIDDPPILNQPIPDIIDLVESNTSQPETVEFDFTSNNFFTDIDSSEIIITADSENVALVTVAPWGFKEEGGQTITNNNIDLTIMPNQSGVATINITATADGKSIKDSFDVIVRPDRLNLANLQLNIGNNNQLINAGNKSFPGKIARIGIWKDKIRHPKHPDILSQIILNRDIRETFIKSINLRKRFFIRDFFLDQEGIDELLGYWDLDESNYQLSEALGGLRSVNTDIEAGEQFEVFNQWDSSKSHKGNIQGSLELQSVSPLNNSDPRFDSFTINTPPFSTGNPRHSEFVFELTFNKEVSVNQSILENMILEYKDCDAIARENDNCDQPYTSSVGGNLDGADDLFDIVVTDGGANTKTIKIKSADPALDFDNRYELFRNKKIKLIIPKDSFMGTTNKETLSHDLELEYFTPLYVKLIGINYGGQDLPLRTPEGTSSTSLISRAAHSNPSLYFTWDKPIPYNSKMTLTFDTPVNAKSESERTILNYIKNIISPLQPDVDYKFFDTDEYGYNKTLVIDNIMESLDTLLQTEKSSLLASGYTGDMFYDDTDNDILLTFNLSDFISEHGDILQTISHTFNSSSSNWVEEAKNIYQYEIAENSSPGQASYSPGAFCYPFFNNNMIGKTEGEASEIIGLSGGGGIGLKVQDNEEYKINEPVSGENKLNLDASENYLSIMFKSPPSLMGTNDYPLFGKEMFLTVSFPQDFEVTYIYQDHSLSIVPDSDNSQSGYIVYSTAVTTIESLKNDLVNNLSNKQSSFASSIYTEEMPGLEAGAFDEIDGFSDKFNFNTECIYNENNGSCKSFLSIINNKEVANFSFIHVENLLNNEWKQIEVYKKDKELILGVNGGDSWQSYQFDNIQNYSQIFNKIPPILNLPIFLGKQEVSTSTQFPDNEVSLADFILVKSTAENYLHGFNQISNYINSLRSQHEDDCFFDPSAQDIDFHLPDLDIVGYWDLNENNNNSISGNTIYNRVNDGSGGTTHNGEIRTY